MNHRWNTDKTGIKITRFPYEEPYHLSHFIEASNGKMGGSLGYYCGANDLSELGKKLIGYLGHNEKIVYQLGSEKSEDRFAFFFELEVISLDSAGHSAIRLRMNNYEMPPAREVCEFCISTNVADVN